MRNGFLISVFFLLSLSSCFAQVDTYLEGFKKEKWIDAMHFLQLEGQENILIISNNVDPFFLNKEIVPFENLISIDQKNLEKEKGRYDVVFFFFSKDSRIRDSFSHIRNLLNTGGRFVFVAELEDSGLPRIFERNFSKKYFYSVRFFQKIIYELKLNPIFFDVNHTLFPLKDLDDLKKEVNHWLMRMEYFPEESEKKLFMNQILLNLVDFEDQKKYIFFKYIFFILEDSSLH